MIYTSIEQLVGNTPLMELTAIERELGLKARVLAKLEMFNPAGSAKDRVALNMLRDYESKGMINKDTVIIEPTSGNTGIGLAAIGTARGIRTIIVMPDTMSRERQLLMTALGAELILTPGADGMKGAIAKAAEIKEQIPGSIIAGQFDNPANPEAHYLTTGPEIWEATEGKVDAFIAGVGTGGTISGTGKYLKEKNSRIHIAAIEPATSPLISRGYSGKHDLQGIGANFIPENYDASVVDEVITITDEEAYEMGRLAGKKEGLLVGITSGAAIAGAAKLAVRAEYEGKVIVTLLPDTGSRYLSTKMFE